MKAPSVLIVRLGALGDIVHALPVAAALRRTFPGARIDWLAAGRHRALLDLVPVVDRRIYLAGLRSGATSEEPAGSSPRSDSQRFAGALRTLRRARYDYAVDLQGLGKSAVLARLSGARVVVGFPRPYLRESWARVFYTTVCDPRGTVHVIDRNLSALAVLGVPTLERAFPLAIPASPIVDTVRQLLPGRSGADFALLNPGGGWPNKRWPPERFAAVAVSLDERHALSSVVLAGPGEDDLARAIVAASHGAAVAAPATTIIDLLNLARAARLVVSGDTGPLHLAAAVGAPVVGIYGPTSPSRNGPWDPRDICLSRFDACVCHHKRRCHAGARWCLLDIGVDEVVAAIDQRLGARC